MSDKQRIRPLFQLDGKVALVTAAVNPVFGSIQDTDDVAGLGYTSPESGPVIAEGEF